MICGTTIGGRSPEVDCRETTCWAWVNYSSAGVAGWRLDLSPGVPMATSTLHVQVKSPPADGAALEALKGQLVPPHLKANYEAGRLKVVIIPVKYDFGELWRWSVILNRFAVSAGNTVGITSAEVGVNVPMYQSPLVWPLEDLNQATSINHAADIRETIVVWALDPHVAAAALPQLLPKLDIPFDAVGVVAHAQRFLEPDVPASAGAQSGSVVATANSDSQDSAGAVSASSGASSPAPAVPSDVESDSDAAAKAPTDTDRPEGIVAEEPPTGQLGSGVDISMWVIAGGGGALAFAMLGAVMVLTVRWRRRRALRVL